ncbi:MAG: hypothetical protein JO108_31825 [Acidobacteriaceae bacterium]|nr:hypothetical protein [Acidobacteriaceae bacterium]
MKSGRFFKATACAAAISVQLISAQTVSSIPPSSPPAGSANTASSDELQALRDRITKQEEAIKKLQQSMEEERALLEKAMARPAAPAGSTTVNTVKVSNGSAGDAAQPVQIVPAVNVSHPHIAWGRQNLQSKAPSSLSISIGDTTFTPLGFVDATFFGRSTNVGSGIGTNFGGIPFNNTSTAHLSETNFSTQNSRIGFRVDSSVLGAKVLGYFEADFLGQPGGNIYVTSNADTFRMRNIFVDVQRNGLEILGGQDWSMFTPNRRGLSPIPSDIFYTQNMDTNYQAGLVWSRQTQFRFIGHPTENLAFGVSLENPQQYIGGSGGLSSTAVTLPANPAIAAAGGQFDNGNTTYATPNLHPDIIFKAAYDGHVGANDKIMHVEAGALIRSFKDTVAVGTPTSYRSSSTTAASGEVNANLEVIKNFRIIANTFFGSGGGRYVFGLVPDVIIRPDGTISPIHTYSTVDGFELNLTKNTLLDMYYGGVYAGRNVAIDTNGSPIGYGFHGSSNSNNRTIQEGTIGVTQTFWKSPNYGALSLITQYSYLTRNPWSVLTGQPKVAKTNMYWVDLRYTLP